jgi:putative DNA primase/helicase
VTDIVISPTVRGRKAGNARKRQDTTGELTEMDVAAICEDRWAGHRVFEHRRGRWYVERKGIWECDEVGETLRDAQKICRGTGSAQFATLRKVKAVEELARFDPRIRVTSDIFDGDSYVLGTPAGPVDLRTGELLPPDPGRFITMSTPVAPDASRPTPQWTRFLHQVTGGDLGVVRLLQQWCGYSLTGDTREQKMAFVYGRGRNGKGVCIRALAGILGTYAHRAQPETFTTGADRHPTELAAMRGKRLVYVAETERGRKWAEGRIKDITGGDKLRARFMRQDEFEFMPEFKLLVSGNYEPQIESADEAMRNRFFVIPFDQVFAGKEADQHLDEKLRAEWPGILAWAIEGCLDWQTNGLVLPAKVQAATGAYFERQDVFTQWLAQETLRGTDLHDTNTRLFRSWSSFAKDNGEDAGTMKAFAERMNRAGFSGPHPTTLNNVKCRVYRGVRALAQ